MATVTLHPGAVTTSGSATGSLVGSGAVWSDGSDATYLDTSATAGLGTTFAGTAALDLLSLPAGATANSVSVTMRASGETDSATNPFVNVEIFDGSSVDIGVSWPVGVLPTTGVPTDVSRTLSTEYASWGVTMADLMAALSAGASIMAYSLSPHSAGTMHEHVYELAVVVDYDGGEVDLPCDTWVDVDLSTAVFVDSGAGILGQYVDDVITGLDGQDAHFSFPLSLDPVRADLVEVTFDPSSSHDGDGDPSTSDRFVLLRDYLPGDEVTAGDDVQIGDGFSNTADVCTLRIGPTIGNWDDPDFGVAQGYTGLRFLTPQSGAVSAIRIRKICTTFAPPLRLTNRRDMFASARCLTGDSSRQGSNRLTGYL